MRLLKHAMAVLGTATMIVVLMAVIAPKTTRSLAAALVQIVPGTTTHVGQHESQLVSLICRQFTASCNAVDSSGNTAGEAYQVPAGYTLVITDYEFLVAFPNAPQGALQCDGFIAATPLLWCAVSDLNGQAYGKEHFTTGILVGSGVTLFDRAGNFGRGNIQGYLVPND